ncbi:MAG: lytic murein transglycosylase [Candidatus Pacebacteria bacterium]|nr:lytic murein transglycosylase [Candidatus Paceibacterota bacterium]
MSHPLIPRYILSAVLVLGAFFLVYPAIPTLGADDPAVADCKNFISSASQSEFDNPNSKASQCRTLITLFAELDVQQKQLEAQQGVSGTLTGDIKVISSQISVKKTQVKAKIAHIGQLTNSIGEKKVVIETLTEKIDREKRTLAKLLRKTNESDRSGLVDFLSSSETLSDFSSDIVRFDTLKESVRNSVQTVKTIKGVTEKTKAELEKQQDKAYDEKQSLIQVQNDLAKKESTQKTLLSLSKDKEAQYKKLIAQQQAKVAEIKSKLFSLAGGSQAIRFDVALGYANEAAKVTGVDPAFLLAELKQESNLGSNVGKCYLTNINTGAGINVNGKTTYKNVMKPTRDVQPFIDITTGLGFNYLKTAVSCPIAGVAGWGGAMGPAQFIASTWKIVAKQAPTKYGVTITNPWSAHDAFMASAMYLADLGGVGKSASAQLRAACKYYGSGGSTCAYGRSVQKIKASIQSDIDYLQQYGVTKNGN